MYPNSMQFKTFHYEAQKLNRLKNFYRSNLRSKLMTIDNIVYSSILASHDWDQYLLDMLNVVSCRILMDSLKEKLLYVRHANILSHKARSKDQFTHSRAYLIPIRLFWYFLMINCLNFRDLWHNKKTHMAFNQCIFTSCWIFR